MKTINSIFKTFVLGLLLITQVHSAYAQTAALLPVAPQQFFDQNGNPVSSGKVWYYVPGQTTPKMVWQDDSQTVPWSNPITLNAGGWPPNNKGIYGNGTYRQLIKDRNGNLISDQPTAAVGAGSGPGSSVGDGNSVGTILTWSGMIAPNQYQFAYGQALSRTTFPELLQAVTLLSSVNCVGGNATLTGLTDTSNIPIGAAVEGICIPVGATVASKTLTTVVLSIAANLSATASIRFFPYGNGDGTLTYNVPDLRGKVIPGRTNMGGTVASNLTSTYYGSGPDAVGANGGTQSHIMSVAELASHFHGVFLNDPGHTHTHNANSANTGSTAGNAGGIPAAANATINSAFTGITVRSATGGGGTANQTANTGSATPFSVVQPSITLNYVIKVSPDASVSGLFGVASIGGMQGIIACGTGVTCAGNIISVTAPAAGGSNTQVQFNNSGALAGDPCFTWATGAAVLAIGGAGCTGVVSIKGGTSGTLNQTVNTNASNPVVTWGNSSGTPAVTASAPLSINATTGNVTISGSALTKTDDTNVTLTLGGSPTTSLLNAASLTLGWTGTLAAGRLNSNVVQSIVNDTNVTGSISAQALTFGWAGTLAVPRGGTGAGSFTSGNPLIGAGTSALTQGTRSGNTTAFATVTGSFVSGNCVRTDANGNFIDAGATCGGGGGGSPGGSTGNIQYNNAGAFGGLAQVDVPRGGTGAASFTSGAPVVGAGTSALTAGTKSGNTTQFVTATGSTAAGCMQYDASGNAVSTGVACGGASSIVTPQGRLTLVSGAPVVATSQAAKNTLYYTPYAGNVVSLYNGSTFTPTAFPEVSQLSTDTTKSPTAAAASSVYDILCWSDSGTPRCTRSFAWTNSSTRCASCGLTLQNGIYVNTTAVTNGPGATLGTYVGTVATDASSLYNYIFASAGSGGVAGLLNVWNAYNRVYIETTVFDTGISYQYSSSIFRQARASAGNQISFVIGLSVDSVSATYVNPIQLPNVSGSVARMAVGYDSCSTASGIASYGNNAAVTLITTPTAPYSVQSPAPGTHFFCAMENADGTNNTTFNLGGAVSTTGLTGRIWQ